MIWKVNVHGIQLSTSELSPVICIRLHQPFRKIVHPDLKAPEKNGEITTTFPNFFLWLTRLITNSLEFTSNFYFSSVFNFQTFFFFLVILFLASSRSHLVPNTVPLWSNLLTTIKLSLNILSLHLYANI